MSSSFTLFKRQLEGHLFQVGAGHLFEEDFVVNYMKLGTEYFKSDTLQDTKKISYNQAIFDMKYLYGILMTATREQQHKSIIRHQYMQDGIMTWHEFKADFDNDGSKELKQEQLEAQIQIT